MSEEDGYFKLQDFTIDQMAGSIALVISSVGALLTIVFQSRCFCKCRAGISDKYSIFLCERKPPVEDEKKRNDIKKNDTKTDKSLIPTENDIEMQQVKP